jgi:2-keto-4-pentenoate hydratase
MPHDEIGDWARNLLAGLDAPRPGWSFAPPAGLTMASAYALQREVVRLREDRGERVIGYKLGCTSRVIQEQLGVREPIFGRVFDTGCFPAGSSISSSRFARLAVEGELAVRLSRDLPGGPLPDDHYIEAIESVFPVIELHHFVLDGKEPSVSALIAINAMHAGLVLPDRETRLSDSLHRVEALTVTINDVRVGSTTEPWTLGGPAAALRWLAGRLYDWGERLMQGQVILTGSALPLFPVEVGCRVVVEATPLGRSDVEVDF